MSLDLCTLLRYYFLLYKNSIFWSRSFIFRPIKPQCSWIKEYTALLAIISFCRLSFRCSLGFLLKVCIPDYLIRGVLTKKNSVPLDMDIFFLVWITFLQHGSPVQQSSVSNIGSCVWINDITTVFFQNWTISIIILDNKCHNQKSISKRVCQIKTRICGHLVIWFCG